MVIQKVDSHQSSDYISAISARSSDDSLKAQDKELLIGADSPSFSWTEAEWKAWIENFIKQVNDTWDLVHAEEYPGEHWDEYSPYGDLLEFKNAIDAHFKTNTVIDIRIIEDFLKTLKDNAYQQLGKLPSSYFDSSTGTAEQVFTAFYNRALAGAFAQIEALKGEKNKYIIDLQQRLELLESLLNLYPELATDPAIIDAIKHLKEALQIADIATDLDFFQKTNLDFVDKAIKDAEKAYSNAINSLYDPGFPIDPNQDGFDTSIPRKPDGSLDLPALLRKLHDLLYYMYYGDCSNFNIYTAVAAYLTNIAGIWDELSAQDKDSFNKIMGTVPTNGSGKSLGDILAESVMYGKLYDLKGEDYLLQKFLYNLQNKLEGIDSPLIKDFLNGLKKVEGNLDNWKREYVSSNGDWIVSFEAFLKQQSLSNASLGRSKEMSDLLTSIVRVKLQELEAIAHGDPFLLFYLILMLLFEQNDNYQTDIGGVGKILERLAELGDEAADIAILFQQICERAKTDVTDEDFLETYDMIEKLMENSKQFCEEFKSDPRIKDSFAEISDAFEHLFSTDPTLGLKASYKDNSGTDIITHRNEENGEVATIGEYFSWAKKNPEGRVSFVKDFFNLCGPGKVDPSKINPTTGQPYAPDAGPHYSQLIADIQAFAKAPLNMNSTLTVKMEDIKSTAEQFGAMITKFAKEPNDLVHRMLERIQK